jgi:hypothetical protein
VLAAILGAALTANQLLRFHSVEQSCDTRRPLDHPIGDLERGQSLVSRTAQDPQHVELLERNAVRFDDGGAMAADQVGGAHQTEHRLVAGRLERPALSNLTLQGG